MSIRAVLASGDASRWGPRIDTSAGPSWDWPSVRAALLTGAARAQTRRTRVAAYVAFGRDRWQDGPALLLELFRESPRAELRLAISEALARVWRNRFPKLEELFPLLHELFPEGDPHVRRMLIEVSPYCHRSQSERASLVKTLRDLAGSEQDVGLHATIRRTADALAANQLNTTSEIDVVFYGED